MYGQREEIRIPLRVQMTLDFEKFRTDLLLGRMPTPLKPETVVFVREFRYSEDNVFGVPVETEYAYFCTGFSGKRIGCKYPVYRCTKCGKVFITNSVRGLLHECTGD